MPIDEPAKALTASDYRERDRRYLDTPEFFAYTGWTNEQIGLVVRRRGREAVEAWHWRRLDDLERLLVEADQEEVLAASGPSPRPTKLAPHCGPIVSRARVVDLLRESHALTGVMDFKNRTRSPKQGSSLYPFRTGGEGRPIKSNGYCLPWVERVKEEAEASRKVARENASLVGALALREIEEAKNRVIGGASGLLVGTPRRASRKRPTTVHTREKRCRAANSGA